MSHKHTSRSSSTGRITRSPTYYSWSKMWERCRPGHVAYKRYKAVHICDRWRKFENFLADMGERPAGTSLDRIDNSGDYMPDNCRWATRVQQANNRANSRVWQGKTAVEWAGIWKVHRSTASKRIRKKQCQISHGPTLP